MNEQLTNFEVCMATKFYIPLDETFSFKCFIVKFPLLNMLFFQKSSCFSAGTS